MIPKLTLDFEPLLMALGACVVIIIVLLLIAVYGIQKRRVPMKSSSDTPLSDEQLRARLREINLDLDN